MIKRGKGGVLKTVIANVTVQAVIYQSQYKALKNINLKTSWAKSLCYRMAFVKHTCTTSKPKKSQKSKTGS